MSIQVIPYSDQWPAQFALVAAELAQALDGVPVGSIEHVGSTAVPGLAAKPIIDIDVVVRRPHVAQAIKALETAGYEHVGDLGLADREAFKAPDQGPSRHVYVCVEGTLHLRNHLAVRDVLRSDVKLRQRYEAVKLALAGDAEMDIDTYIAGKSAVLQDVLSISDLTAGEKAQILALNSQT
ncbi:GrpB family protein [Microbacterium sp. 22195]|uniref:GrpB family protein n=1 Tax=Microbacterium sp. 22195 TaxID=3453891 RepID=UPI003F87DE17